MEIIYLVAHLAERQSISVIWIYISHLESLENFFGQVLCYYDYYM